MTEIADSQQGRLDLRRRKRRRLPRGDRLSLPAPVQPLQRWSLDFMSDQLASGRRFRILNIVDDCSRECPGQIVDLSISGARLARFLDELASRRGLPKALVMDNGPELTSKAMFEWSQRTRVALHFIEPGKPVVTLVAIDDLRIEFRVPQEFYPRINSQSAVSVTLDALPERNFDGTIDAVVPVSDASSRTFLIHVRVDAGDARLTPGMSVHGKLNLTTGRRGVVISRDAILRYSDGRITVWVINPDSEPPTVSEKRVTTDHSFDGLITIREGIQAGDAIVVRGNESLQEGQQVRIQHRE